jgi:cephalosporin hydroxylase
MKNVYAPRDSTLTLDVGGDKLTVDLYTKEGFDLLNILLLKVGAEQKVMYEPTWLGRPIIQFANDIVAIQEILWNVQPDLVIETGVAHGGSLILSASILQLIGRGRVLGVDIEIRPHNLEAINNHPLRHRIDLIEGSSIASETFAAVLPHANSAKKIMVILDSNHSAAHVRREMELYAPLVSVGSYLVVHDGAQAWVSEIPRGKPEWKDDHPLIAIHGFLKENRQFDVDPSCSRFGVTSSPSGFLKRTG